MYGKLFAQMYDGTLATKGPWQALVTFQQMIILADQDGVLDMTADALARRTTIPLEIIQLGIAELEKSDPDSRTPDEEGRRIVRIRERGPWGWRIVNHAHYRRIRSEEERREYHRNYQRNRRAKAVDNLNVNTTTTCQQNQPIAVGSKQNAARRKQSEATIISQKVDRFVARFYANAPERRRTEVVAQLRSTLDVTGPGARVEGDRYAKARDLAHLERCCQAVLRKPPDKPDAAIRILFLKLCDPILDEHGRTVTEAASAATNQMGSEVIAERRKREMSAEEWGRHHPKEYSELNAIADQLFPGDNPFAADVRICWLLDEIEKRELVS